MDMVERVARAISADIDEGLPRFTAQRWEDLSWPAKAALLKRASAAIAAMREPTAQMLACRVSLPWDREDQSHYLDSDAIGELWDDMIDAALTPAPPEQ